MEEGVVKENIELTIDDNSSSCLNEMKAYQNALILDLHDNFLNNPTALDPKNSPVRLLINLLKKKPLLNQDIIQWYLEQQQEEYKSAPKAANTSTTTSLLNKVIDGSFITTHNEGLNILLASIDENPQLQSDLNKNALENNTLVDEEVQAQTKTTTSISSTQASKNRRKKSLPPPALSQGAGHSPNCIPN